jgi:hypothetical protein
MFFLSTLIWSKVGRIQADIWGFHSGNIYSYHLLFRLLTTVVAKMVEFDSKAN